MKNKFLITLFLSFVCASALAAEPVSTGRFNNKAVNGHNVIAYHSLSFGDKAVEGVKVYSVEWKGANWYFASEAERERFKVNPETYAPAYNGFCANALSLGEGLIRTSGKHWALFDDQLYLFYAARGAKRWLNGSYKEYKVVSDREWAVILEK